MIATLKEPITRKRALTKAFASLFHLLIQADGVENPKEIEYGNSFISYQGINKEEFELELKMLRTLTDNSILVSGLKWIKHLSKTDQTNLIAWLCVIANSDGFMDSKEWSFIYRVYAKELKLLTEDIMNEQKRVHKEIINPTGQFVFGITVNK